MKSAEKLTRIMNWICGFAKMCSNKNLLSRTIRKDILGAFWLFNYFPFPSLYSLFALAKKSQAGLPSVAYTKVDRRNHTNPNFLLDCLSPGHRRVDRLLCPHRLLVSNGSHGSQLVSAFTWWGQVSTVSCQLSPLKCQLSTGICQLSAVNCL